MLKISVLSIFVFGSMIVLPADLFAGAWTVPEGHWYIESYSKYYWADSDFNADGKKTPKANNGFYEEIRTELKAEYGLRDNLNLLLSLPFKHASYEDDNGTSTTTGLEDLWLRTKFRLTQEPVVSSLIFGAKFPAGYDENDSPALGDGQIDGEIKFLVGKSFPSRDGFFPFYIGAEVGFRPRNKEPTNEIPYLLEFGFNPTDRLMFKGTLDGVEGIAGTGKEEEDWLKWTANIVYKISGGFSTVYREETSVNLEIAYGETFDGRNTAVGSEIVLNIAFQF